MKKLMCQSSIAFHLLSKNLFVNTILILLICTCVLFSDFVAVEVKNIDSNYRFISSLKQEKMLLYMGQEPNLEQIKEPYTPGTMKYCYLTNGAKLHFYGQSLVQHIDIPLSKGSWDCQPKEIGGTVYYPVVINQETSKYHYNQSIRVQLQNGTPVNLYICGVLAKDQKYVNLTVTANAVNADHLIKECDRDSLYLFGIEEQVPADVLNGMYIYNARSRFLFFEDSISNEAIQENYKILRNQGYTYTYESLQDHCYDHFMQGYTYYLPLLICLSLLTAVGIVGFTVLSVKSNSSYYRCFLLCGGTKQDCINLSLLNIAWILLFSMIIGVFLTTIGMQIGFFGGWHQFSAINIVLSIVIYLFVFGVSTVITWLLLRKKSILQLLKAEA